MTQFELYLTTNPTDNKTLAVLKEGKQVMGKMPNVSTDGLLIISRSVKLIPGLKVLILTIKR
ncbi:hypothetical protein [Anabaena sp. CCY 9910]|uniref:hypothetical protein n=1 Tax=Anabaena sp. CCY 9910 TaxID=3103870 RepID=UPI0039E05700